jgi:phospholipid transport system transporter-binding protein
MAEPAALESVLGGVHEARIETRDAAGGRFAVLGELVFATARRISERAIHEFSACAARSLAVDLSGVRAADSAGLSVLIVWLEWAHANARELTFSGVPAGIRALARISEVEGVLEKAVRA